MATALRSTAMNTAQYLLTIVFVSFSAVFLMMVPLGVYMAWMDTRARKRLVEVLRKKMEADDIDVSAEDARRFARALGVSIAGVGKAVAQLMVMDLDSQTFRKVQALAAELDRVDPLEQLPQEVKPSLVRLLALVERSSEKSDLVLLGPVQRALADFVDLKAEVARTRRVTNFVNLIAVIGFFVGLVGFYATLTGPTIADIRQVVREAFAERQSLAAPDRDQRGR